MHDLDAALRPWTARAAELVARRVADARAHAESGRVSDAHARLDELRHGLLGARRNDSAGLLRDARAAFYRAAFDDHAPLDPAIHQTDLGPSADDAEWIRTTPHFDADWLRLEAVLAEARGHLSQSAAATSERADLLAGWEARHRDRLTVATRGMLSDSQMTIHHVVGRLLIKPELR
jgi:hypothetical protein